LPDADGQPQPLETYIPAEQGDLLYSLVKHLRPKRTLEVGLANGISALYIATALREMGQGTHLAIDPFQHRDWRSVGMVTLSRAGFESLVSLEPRCSHWALPDLEEAGERFQFAFIDGSHLMDYVMSDFMNINRVLDIGGLIAFDDSDWPAVNQVIRFALANCDYAVFPTEVVIEPCPPKPRLLSRCVRSMVRRSQRLQRIIRGDFVRPASELQIEGRCVVLEKRGSDKRHALQGQLMPF
jgi:predicted O-methyltransferase YrrM